MITHGLLFLFEQISQAYTCVAITTLCMQRIIRPCCCSSGCRASSVYSSHPGREDRIQSLSSYTYCFIELSSIIMTKPACITVYKKYTHTASLVTATSRYYYSRNVTHAAYAKTDPASANTLHNAITCTIANTTINRVCLLGLRRGVFPCCNEHGEVAVGFRVSIHAK